MLELKRGLMILAGTNSAFLPLFVASLTEKSVGWRQRPLNFPSTLIEPEAPAGRVLHLLAWPVFTTSANLELPLSPEAETLLGAAIKVRQNASTKASKGRNRMRGSRKGQLTAVGTAQLIQLGYYKGQMTLLRCLLQLYTTRSLLNDWLWPIFQWDPLSCKGFGFRKAKKRFFCFWLQFCEFV